MENGDSGVTGLNVQLLAGEAIEAEAGFAITQLLNTVVQSVLFLDQVTKKVNSVIVIRVLVSRSCNKCQL